MRKLTPFEMPAEPSELESAAQPIRGDLLESDQGVRSSPTSRARNLHNATKRRSNRLFFVFPSPVLLRCRSALDQPGSNVALRPLRSGGVARPRSRAQAERALRHGDLNMEVPRNESMSKQSSTKTPFFFRKAFSSRVFIPRSMQNGQTRERERERQRESERAASGEGRRKATGESEHQLLRPRCRTNPPAHVAHLLHAGRAWAGAFGLPSLADAPIAGSQKPDLRYTGLCKNFSAASRQSRGSQVLVVLPARQREQ